MNARSTFAVFRRNLFSYFSSPTGYVFVCVFVALGSMAAFWSPAFFDNNLANLSSLNFFFPAVMLFFVPAITMSLWAEERRQSTDELLLTLPVTDLDIVLGKYLAAVAIYAVSLVFSLVSNLIVLQYLGKPDLGLFLCTYLGYLVVGMAMLSIGMMASFVTSNLTIAFVLGALFNAPLVLLQFLTALLPRSEWAQALKSWSIGDNFDDFGRGVVSLSSLVYFAGLVGLMLYVCLVLIGQRHWLGGRDGKSLLGHYLARTAALALLVVGASYFFRNHDLLRLDLTSDGLNSLSPDTRSLLAELKPERRIEIEAFVSPDVPEAYVQARLNLLSYLRELDRHPNISVRVYDTESRGEVARRAEDRYGITRKEVSSQSSTGKSITGEIFLGAAFRSGLNKVVIPFFDLGAPIEYELVRSITTVGQPKRKVLGVVQTDAALFGRFGSPPQLIIGELKKQYEVVEVDPARKIGGEERRYDALLVVQPSSLPAPQLANVIDAVKAGVPTAVFEDPFPAWVPSAAGTSQPRKNANPFGMMGHQPPPPKGNVDELFRVLGVEMVAHDSIIWQAYNPYPILREQMRLGNEWVFAGASAPGARAAFNEDDPISAGLKEVLFPFPGAFRQLAGSSLEFVPLVKTGTSTGTIRFGDIRDSQDDPYALRYAEKRTGERYVLAARVHGKPKEGDGKKDLPAINAVVVADIDLLASTFVRLRAKPDPVLNPRFQNVPFVLNVIDSLAGDSRFINIRNREQRHRTLSRFEEILNTYRLENEKSLEEYRKDSRKKTEEAQKAQVDAILQLQKDLADLQKADNFDIKKEEAAKIRLAMRTESEAKKLAVTKEALKRELARKVSDNENRLKRQISDTQFTYQMLAVFLPPIPPLLLAAFVLARRRWVESEGAAASRLR